MKKEHVKGMIESVGKTISPDGDWMNTLILETNGSATVVGMPMSMADDTDRAIVAHLITETIRGAKADAAVWITTAWMVMLAGASDAEIHDAIKLAEQHKLTQHHRRIECVTALIGHRNAGCAMISGKIIRRPNEHPLVEWQDDLPDDSAAQFAGRFPEALMEGLRE
jgi:hypothetical protein